MFGHTPAATIPAVPRRHALRLPAGSVRALLAFSVLGLSWLLAWQTGMLDKKLPLVFIYLQFLGILILAHYFAAHGNSIGTHISTSSPLGLPSGTVRLALLAGYVGLAVYMYWHAQLEFVEPVKGPMTFMLLVLLSGFFLGHLITGLVQRMAGGTLPYWFQDFQAWIALLAMLGLGILAVVYLFINPTLDTAADTQVLEAVLAGLIGFYFGARS